MSARLYMILAMILFGSVGLFVRSIQLPPANIALLRGILGSLVLFFIVFVFKKPLRWPGIKENLPLLLMAGAAIGINWVFLFQAYRYTSIANATLSYYFSPVFVILLSPLILKEHLTLLKFFCVLGTVGGLFLVVGFDQSLHADALKGVGYGLLAAVFYASVVLINKFFKGLNGLEITLIQLLAAAVVMLIYIPFGPGFQFSGVPVQSWLYVLFVGIVHTGLGYYLYFHLLQKLPGQTVASLSYIDPVSAMIMAAIIFHEALGLWQIIGAALILSATFVAEKYGHFTFRDTCVAKGSKRDYNKGKEEGK